MLVCWPPSTPGGGARASVWPARHSPPCGPSARNPSGVRAYLGPAVAPDRYQVSDEVHRTLAGAVGRDALDEDVARADGPGHWLVDLVAANRQQLHEAGLRDDHVCVSGTTTSDSDFFSDRARRPCGRFALHFARLQGDG